MGLGPRMRALSSPMSGGAVRTHKGEILVKLSYAFMKERCGTDTIFMHRADLLNALFQAHGNSGVHLNAECSGFTQDKSGVSVLFKNGKTAHGDVLIGADGVKSAIRAQLFPASVPRYQGYTCWRGVTKFEYPPDADWWGESWGLGARAGFLPLHGGRVAWWVADNRPQGQHDSAAGRQQDVLEVIKDWHQPLEKVVLATPKDSILRNDISDIHPLALYSVNRVTLLGDAAHAMTPNLGQGACQAIEDAYVLGKVFRDERDETIQERLRRYDSLRVPRGRLAIEKSYFFGLTGQWKNPLACAFRNALTRFTPSNFVIKEMMEFAGHNPL
jgi:2-polyprenyl-6-methoxyphenol hydroxylase-like FAD-dependent oxidoreductase